MYKPSSPPPPKKKKKSQEKLPSCQPTKIPSGRKAACFPLGGGYGSAPTRVQVPAGVAVGRERTWVPPAAESTQPAQGSQLGGSLRQARQCRGGLRSRWQPPRPAPSSPRGRRAGGWSVDVHCQALGQSSVGKASVLGERKARRRQ